MKKENVEIIEDDQIITLYDTDENPIDFYEVACVEYRDEFYGLLQPVEEVDGIGEDEVIICKIEETEDGSQNFVPLTDETLMNNVFEEYLKAAADMDCGCDCDHCHGECGGEHDCGGEHNCDCGEDGCNHCGH